MLLRKVYVLFVLIFLSSIATASRINWTPPGDINGRDYYNIYGIANMTAGAFYGDGSGLTGVTATSTSSKGTSGPYLYNDSDIIYYNESKLNSTIIASAPGNTSAQIISAVNGTALNGSSFVSIVWNNLVGRLITSVQSKWFSVPSGVLTFDETELNSTIDARDTDTNNYATGVSVTGTNTKTITISRSGLLDISDTFSDIDTNESARLSILETKQSADNSTQASLINQKFNTSGGTITGSVNVQGDVNATSYRNVEIQNKADGQTWVVFQ